MSWVISQKFHRWPGVLLESSNSPRKFARNAERSSCASERECRTHTSPVSTADECLSRGKSPTNSCHARRTLAACGEMFTFAAATPKAFPKASMSRMSCSSASEGGDVKCKHGRRYVVLCDNSLLRNGVRRDTKKRTT